MVNKDNNPKSILYPDQTNTNRIFFVILMLIFAGGFTLDNLDLGNETIYLKTLKTYLNNTKIISQSFTTISASISAIIFAVYIVLIQLFRNRYPIDFIEAIYKSKISYVSYNYVLNIVFGVIFIVLDINFPICTVLYLFHVLYCLYLFTRLFKDYKVFNLTKVLETYEKNIIEIIEQKVLDKKEIKGSLRELSRYSEDSFIKDEIYLAKYISNLYKKLVLHFLENKDKLINRGISEEDIKEVERSLFMALKDQIEYCVNYNYHSYLTECFDLIEDVFITIIKCDKVDTFTGFSKIMDRLFSYNVFHKNWIVGIQIIDMYGNIASYVVEKNKREEWFKILNEKFALYRVTSSVFLDDSILKALIKENLLFIEICIKENSEFFDYKKSIGEISRLYIEVAGQCNTKCIKLCKCFVLSSPFLFN